MIINTYTSNDLESYATTSEVTNIVNTAIESGEIVVSSSPFKSIKTYSITNDTTGITLTGSGLATPFAGSNGILVIDGETKSVHANSSNLNPVLFEKSCVIKTSGTSGGYSIKVSVGLFND